MAFRFGENVYQVVAKAGCKVVAKAGWSFLHVWGSSTVRVADPFGDGYCLSTALRLALVIASALGGVVRHAAPAEGVHRPALEGRLGERVREVYPLHRRHARRLGIKREGGGVRLNRNGTASCSSVGAPRCLVGVFVAARAAVQRADQYFLYTEHILVLPPSL